MATIKQIKAVERMVENGGVASSAMIDVGYSKQTAKSPHKLTNSKGFKELCEERGLTDMLILDSLVDDIKGKPKDRTPELTLASKIKGLLVDRSEVKSQVELSVLSDEDKQKLLTLLDDQTGTREGN